MTGLLQRVLMTVYAAAKASGLLDSRPGQWIFRRAYFTYKRWLEPEPLALRQHVRPGSWVIDVGANLGFYTLMFSRWTSEGGKVVSIEPATENFAELQRLVAARCHEDAVVAVQAVASELDGSLRLRLNPESHADHRIADDGVQTKSVRLDSLLAQHGNPAISLVKIDVQGAEPRVLAGSVQTLRTFSPAVYMEVDDQALKDSGSSAAALVEWMHEEGYRPHAVTGKRVSDALSMAEMRALMGKLGYADFLFLPVKAPEDAATQNTPM